MPLSLDLRDSRAKWNRASEHVEVLNRQVEDFVNHRNPYTVRVGEIDEQTGWCSYFVSCGPVSDERGLAVIAGDVIHNLRSALDYIVTALVLTSGTALTNRHQFPIFATQEAYFAQVGNPAKASKGRGPLKGVIHGLREIEAVQPYYPNGDVRSHPLWHLYESSNADKHRAIAMQMPLPMSGNLGFDMDADLVEHRIVPVGMSWGPGIEHEAGRMRFAKPYPTYVRPRYKPEIDVMFASWPLKGRGLAHDVALERDMCRLVGKFLDLFEQL